MDKCKLLVISQERLKIEVKLLLSANRKSYMPRRLAQQRITLCDLEWPSHAISAVVELLVIAWFQRVRCIKHAHTLSLYGVFSIVLKNHISAACRFFSVLKIVHVSHTYNKTDHT